MIGSSFTIAAWAALWVAGAAPGEARPWENVTPEREEKARALFDQGVHELRYHLWEEAARDFRKAIEHADFPLFHLNLAAALDELGKQIEARDHLLTALKYGSEGLEQEAFQKAQDKLKVVESKLSKLALSCDQAGAKVTLDDRKDLFTCPSTYEQWMQPGVHVISIRLDQPGYSVPKSHSPKLLPGERAAFKLEVPSDDDLRPYKGLPLIVLGGGVLLAGGGGTVMALMARSEFKAYDDLVAACAGEPVPNQVYLPCAPETVSTLVAPRVRGYRWQVGAAGAIALGAAAAGLGVYLIVNNSPRPPPAAQVAVVPVLAPGTAGAALAVGF